LKVIGQSSSHTLSYFILSHDKNQHNFNSGSDIDLPLGKKPKYFSGVFRIRSCFTTDFVLYF